jgi:pimeloyl-ACP methyl ester carboxylesterase
MQRDRRPLSVDLTIDNGDVRLHAVAEGPADGPVVILLHGFPEFWYGWRRQIGPLAAAGFRVIAPDQRGYNLSSKPEGIARYALRELVADVLAICDAAGRDQVCVAGHDWGGAVAWSFAARYPARVRRLAVLNIPHPTAMWNYLRSEPVQMLRSWYMLFFQAPRLPEILLSRFGEAALVRTSRHGTFPPEDLARYREAWRQPGARTGMINWYRALRLVRSPKAPLIEVPVRILWGDQDRFLLPGLARESLRYCGRADLIRFPAATHWIQHEEAERVNELLIEWFRKSD